MSQKNKGNDVVEQCACSQAFEDNVECHAGSEAEEHVGRQKVDMFWNGHFGNGSTLMVFFCLK